MAQKAKKDRAKSNVASLNNLHLGSLIVNILFLAFRYFFKTRSLIAYVLISIPSLLCELTLERSGRPTYDAATGSLKTAGEDLAAPGLTEYMFDVIWVTWGTVVLVLLFGNKLWFFWTIVPAYGAYKGYSLFGTAKQMASMQGADPGAAPAGNRRQRRAA